MPFQPIVLSAEGDVLTIPEQRPLTDITGDEYPSRIKLPDDPEALALGEYPFEAMIPVSDAYGAPLHHIEGKMVGVHGSCHNHLERRPISNTHHAVVCTACALRIILPSTVKTYSDLRRHFSDLQSSA